MSTKQSLPRWLRKFDVSYTKSIIFSPGVIIGRALRYLWKKKKKTTAANIGLLELSFPFSKYSTESSW